MAWVASVHCQKTAHLSTTVSTGRTLIRWEVGGGAGRHGCRQCRGPPGKPPWVLPVQRLGRPPRGRWRRGAPAELRAGQRATRRQSEASRHRSRGQATTATEQAGGAASQRNTGARPSGIIATKKFGP
ncbi:hypothetical protein PVAP13_9KG165500 [Panicum virgatum]|uniref:Uncharacterized protein n=1 Tax=Panicum virgatum TaxID=38727 RepID=A0A8T0NMC9_PANVG|nr:hypothetical protein PVAP13_9KG165500 [Panicum virgatum]